ncbi:DUF937 domain-containing protein [Methylobacterium planeticum]|uniref:DUF937 domain-containing protein n=1 Tax=Methylobacterium planeticum TaxID=2615211 RepID=UPI001FEE1ED0|nr:DUF937 domain-containing protein [Methylobacterium planeticum]
MFNPIDMLQAQGAAAWQGMGQPFGLTPDQTRRALEALMPAFALGMQRNAAQDPTGLSQFFGLAPGRTPAGAEAMLGGMFGSPALAQAVLQQASSASGVGSQVLRQMLPMMAGMIVASIVHMMLNQTLPEPAPRAAPEPANPLLAAAPLWADMMKAFLPPPAAAPKRPGAPRAPAGPKAEPAADQAPLDMFQQMLRTGAEVQEQNVQAMQNIFEAFWTDPAKPAEAPRRGAPRKRPEPRKR